MISPTPSGSGSWILTSVSGMGWPTEVKSTVVLPVDAGDAADLGLAVDLLQVHPAGVEKTEHVRPQGRAAGAGRADIGEAQPVLERPEKSR
jgi:hypothetical protein